MKFKVGDLAFYTGMSEKDPPPTNPPLYMSLRMRYPRPFYMEEANNLGIILQIHKSNSLFLKTNKNYNTYVWHSQQTNKTWLVFECELTSEEEHAKMGSYAISFLSPLAPKSK